MAHEGVRRDFVPTNQDLADMLGRTDFHSDNYIFLNLFRFQISSRISWISVRVESSKAIGAIAAVMLAVLIGRVHPHQGRIAARADYW